MKIKTFKLKSSDEIRDLKDGYIKSLVAPMDSYWEKGIIENSFHYEIKDNTVRIGYFCVNSRNCMVQFYLVNSYMKHAQEIFFHILSNKSIKNATAGTNEPAYVSLCLDNQKKISIHSYIFEDNEHITPRLKEFKNTNFRPASISDISEIEDHYLRNVDNLDIDLIEMSYGDLTGYIESLIEQEQLFILSHNTIILGLGECRNSLTQPEYADLGMVVDKKYRCSFVINLI